MNAYKLYNMITKEIEKYDKYQETILKLRSDNFKKNNPIFYKSSFLNFLIGYQQ